MAHQGFGISVKGGSSGRKRRRVEQDEEEGNVPRASEEFRESLHDTGLMTLLAEVRNLEEEWVYSLMGQVDAFMLAAVKNCEEGPGSGTTSNMALVPVAPEEWRVYNSIEAQVRSKWVKKRCVRLTAAKGSTVKAAFDHIAKRFGVEGGMGTPRVLAEKMKGSGHLVLVVEGADSFGRGVLPGLLKLLSSSKLPFIYFMGVSGGLRDWSRIIPRDGSHSFAQTTFKVVSSKERFNQVLYKILDPDLWPIMLGGNIMSYLQKYFYCQSMSIARLLQAVRICYLEHYRKPEALLCFKPDTMKAWENEDKVELNKTSKTSELKGITNRDSLWKANYEGWRAVTSWNFSVRVIAIVQAAVLKTTPIEIFADLYISCATGAFFVTPEEENESPCQRFLTQLKMLSKSALARVLTRLNSEFGTAAGTGFLATRSDAYVARSCVPEFVQSFETIYDKLETLEEREKQEKLLEEKTTPTHRTKLRKGMSLADLKKTLITKIEADTTSRPFAELRSEFVDFMESNLKKYLKPSFNTRLRGPCYNGFLYDDVDHLKELFSPSPLVLLTNSLSRPSVVLECECCEQSQLSDISPSLPDTAIVFKLLKEQTHKKVDLNILFESFSSVIENSPVVATTSSASKRRGKTKKLDQDVCLVRFRQAIAELQFVGILKRNKSNPDEVTKLLWL